jgi:heat shock protein HslJ
LKLFPHGSKTVELFKVHLQPTLEMLDMHGKPIQSANTYLLAQVSEKAAPSEAATVPLSLESVMWRLTQLDGKGITISAGEQPITMMFDAADTRVSGSLGCNRFNGPYERSTSSLHIGLLAVTRMMCIHDVMVTEDAFVKALTATASYAIEGQVLNLYDRSGRIVAQFKAAGTNS